MLLLPLCCATGCVPGVSGVEQGKSISSNFDSLTSWVSGASLAQFGIVGKA